MPTSPPPLEVWRTHTMPKLSQAPNWVGLWYSRLGLFCSPLVFVAYGKLVWSFLLMAEIRFLSFLLRWKIGLVFFCLQFPPSGNSVWSFLLTVPPVRKLGLVFSSYGSSTVSKKTNRKQKHLNRKKKGLIPPNFSSTEIECGKPQEPASRP